MKTKKIHFTLGCVLLFSMFSTVYCEAQWVQVNSPPNNFFAHHTFGFGLNGKGYLVTGQDESFNTLADFYEYDPLTDTYTQLPDFPGGARAYAIGDTWDGKAYFGFGENESAVPRNDLWVFDPLTNNWAELASCPCAARRHPAMIAHNDKVHVGLGSSNSGDLSDWWIYDIASDTWTQGANFFGGARHHPYQFGLGDYVYAGFGHNGPNIYDQWYRYDLTSDSWEQMESLPAQGRVAGTQFSHNGKGYALSGEGESHSTMPTGEFWRYDPAIDAWEELPPHPGNSRWAPTSFVVNDEVYIVGGQVYFSGNNNYYPEEVYKFNLNDAAVGIENEDQISFSVFPNPFSKQVNITFDETLSEDMEVEILNIHGQVVHTMKGFNSSIDLSFLSNGNYWMKLKSESGTGKKLILKQ